MSNNSANSTRRSFAQKPYTFQNSSKFKSMTKDILFFGILSKADTSFTTSRSSRLRDQDTNSGINKTVNSYAWLWNSANLNIAMTQGREFNCFQIC